MSDIAQALEGASRIRSAVLSGGGYAIAYGSHARSRSLADCCSSDLDLLFVGPPVPAAVLADLVRAVIDLHQQHGLRLDTEVAYDVKLHATPEEAEAALRLRGFTTTAAGRIQADPVTAEPWFLNSAAFKLRLILNALSTPHIYLGGDVELYRAHQGAAGRSIALLALALLPEASTCTVLGAAEALVTGPGGANGEDFLGYVPDAALYSALHRGFAQLAAEHALRPVDGNSFERQPDVCQKLIAGLAQPRAQRGCGQGTMGARRRRMPG